ncbi:ATP-binding protein [Flavobacterium sp.]|jgi:predicted AAA+ superfamily ATPase|uniref:ATP-binding protein n=1 Tax=Flavobacterium sp. TaxID=239 RepID=UPI0037BF427F
MVKFKLPENTIRRTVYLEKVRPFRNTNLIKVFTGQRRVGKSYLLYQIIQEILSQNPAATIVYINKEDLAFSAIKTANDLNDYVLLNKSQTGKTYVFIDEIQDIIEFELALRSLLLDLQLDIYCTGSNANLLSGDIAGFLSGRVIEIQVYSLSYSEFLMFQQLETNVKNLNLYLKYGGLPYLKHLKLEDEIVFEYLKNIYSTIIYRDIINRYSVRNVSFLEQLVLFLASNTGSIFSAKKISDFLKSQRINIAPNQVQIYNRYLVNAFIIQAVSRYDIIGKRIFEIGEKYYFENLGIRNALWGYRLEDRAKIIENAVYNHLAYCGYKISIGMLGDKEIDFIAEKNGEKKYIQVALSIHEKQTLEREFGNLLAIKDNYPKIVITMEPFSGNTVEGIEIVQLENFLLTN